jgi:hypothetical protein
MEENEHELHILCNLFGEGEKIVATNLFPFCRFT